MSQGNSQGDHQEPTLPPLAFTRPATESVEEMRVEEARSVPNLGQSIQAARAAKEMTAADLAQALNLDLRIVEAIEANRFEDAPDPVYIRAYLKHWARLLGVDPAEWISAYNAQSSIESGQDARLIGTRPTLEVMTPHKVNRNVHGNKSGGRIWRGMGTLIVLLLVVAVLILAMPAAWQQWVSARLGGHNATEMGSDRPIALMPPRDGGAKTSINVPLTPPEPSSAPASAAPNAPTAASSSILQALPPPPMGQAETPPAADNAPSVAQPAATEPASTDTPESVSSSSSTTPAPTSDAQVAGDLVIKATDADCWVEVRNADGKRLVYDVLKQGETRQVAGKGPFTVVLGNPAAVEVLWKGQPVKLDAPNATNGVVRTTVGG